MTSKLASGLLAAPLGSAVGDVLWSNADMNDVKTAQAGITLDTARSITSSLTGEELTAFAELIPDPTILDTLVREVTDEEFADGAVANAHLRNDTLDYLLANASPSTRARAKLRLQRLDNLKTAAGTGDADTMVAAYDSLMKRDERSGFAELLLGPDSDLAGAVLGVIKQEEVDDDDQEGTKHQAAFDKHLARVKFRSGVLDELARLDQDRYDEVLGELLGLNGEPAKAQSVDAYIANWLATSDSFPALVAIALLVPDGGARNSEVAPEFASRLSSLARERLKKHETLWDLVAYRTTRGGARSAYAGSGSIPLSYDYLMTLRLSGLSASDISGFVSSSNFELETEELVALLDDIDMLPLASLLRGQSARYLQEGQVSALLADLDDDQFEELREFLKEDKLDHLAWYSELLTSFPRSWEDERLSVKEWELLASIASARLGEDPAAWQRLLTAESGHSGNFSTLVDAAV